ncbi:MAG: helix-turn-helix transcriptional regulator [Pseudomonadota bacterium]
MALPLRQASQNNQAMKIGLVIKGLRIEQGLKLEALANDLELATSTLSRIESGRRNPSLEVLEALAEALGVKVSDIFHEAERATAIASSMTREVPSDYDASGMQLRRIYRSLSAANQAIALGLLRSLASAKNID